MVILTENRSDIKNEQVIWCKQNVTYTLLNM